MLYYLYTKKLDFNILNYWNRIKEHICYQIKNNKLDNEILWKLIDNEIIFSECPICLENIDTTDRYISCNNCVLCRQ